MNDQARAAILGWQQAINAAWDQQAGLLMSAPGQQQPATTRKLTVNEIEIARKVFGDKLDLGQIVLTEDGPVDSDKYAYALPGVIVSLTES